MKLWHLHRWTKWSEPFTYDNLVKVAFWQRRTCHTCGFVQERVL